MSLTRMLIPLLALGFAACAFEPGGDPGDPTPGDPSGPIAGDVDGATPTSSNPDAAVAMVSCRVDGPKLGVDGLTVQVGPTMITVETWKRDPQHLDRIIGFTLSANAAGMQYKVRVGRDDLEATGLVYTVPGPGTISRVEFCD